MPTRKPRKPETFESLLVEMYGEAACAGEGLFLIQGMWRSGTSWLGRMMGAHPQVYVCQHELQSFSRFFEVKPSEQLPFFLPKYEACLKSGFLSMLRHVHAKEKPEAKVYGDRSPGGNATLIKRLFPRAKLPIILRDGRDVCVSVAHLDWTSPGALVESDGQVTVEPSYVRKMAQIYAASVDDYLAVKAAHPADVLILRYEELHRDPVTVMGDVFRFLGADASPALVAGICREHSFQQETGRPSGSPDPGAFARKGIVGDWRNHLSGEGVAAFEEVAGGSLRRAGYDLHS
jgi:hypothetical protein